jgi:hypothetical protein
MKERKGRSRTAAAGKLQTAAATNPMQSLDIQGFSYEERATVLPQLTSCLADCGGWVLERKTLSPTTLEFRIEIQLRSVFDLYAAILAAGVELTRSAHRTLTDLCTCHQHLRVTVDLGHVVALRIEISFLEDVTLHSFLATLAPSA